MEKALVKLVFLVVLIATASCLGHGTEANEVTNEAKPNQDLSCNTNADCAAPDKCNCNADLCVGGTCQCGVGCIATVQT